MIVADMGVEWAVGIKNDVDPIRRFAGENSVVAGGYKLRQFFPHTGGLIVSYLLEALWFIGRILNEKTLTAMSS